MPNIFLKEWRRRLHHWSTMFAGTSYYHQTQGMGRAFVPNELKGYFNDLSGKANWKGKVDSNGLPYNTLTNGNKVYFPIMLCQKALGHWDRWLFEAAEKDRSEFLKIALWLVNNQDASGGWDTWGILGQQEQFRYSAMSQGEALSVMVRAYELTGKSAFESAIAKAIALMRTPVPDGGVCWYESNEVTLEEFPSPKRDTVLNGWIFALFGIHDYLVKFRDAEAGRFYEGTLATLLRFLPHFDAGFWSYYSSGTRRMASPFYHDLHLSQLQALSKVSADSSLQRTCRNWTAYSDNRVCRFRALIIKGLQKIKEPCEVTIVD